MDGPQVGVEIGRFGWLQRFWARLQAPTRRPTWHAPPPVTEQLTGRHARGEVDFMVTRHLPDGNTMWHYSKKERPSTETTIFELIRSGEALERTELVPFRPAGGD